jgi:hypothetical protein
VDAASDAVRIAAMCWGKKGGVGCFRHPLEAFNGPVRVIYALCLMHLFALQRLCRAFYIKCRRVCVQREYTSSTACTHLS